MNATETSELPLAGLRVIELGTMVAGPFAGTLLGDFGAEIIKIEPAAGDTARYVEPVVEGTSLYWAIDARNKTSITCDLRDPQDRQALLTLVATADVVIENFRPGTLERWELGPDVMHGVNPDLVIVRVSGFGQTGERRELPAFDRVVQAMSGYAHTNGFEGTPPVVVGNFVSDYTTAVFAALGCMVALHALRDGAPGQVVDVSSLETMVRLSEVDISLYSRTGELRSRLGNGHLAAAPINAYETSDGAWVMLHVPTDRMFVRLVEVLGLADLENERFGTGASRVEHREALDVVLAQWFADRTCPEALEILTNGGVPAAKMSNASDLVDDQELRRRGAVVEADTPVGPMLMPGVVPRLTATPGRVRFGAPTAPGRHIADALADLVGSAHTGRDT